LRIKNYIENKSPSCHFYVTGGPKIRHCERLKALKQSTYIFLFTLLSINLCSSQETVSKEALIRSIIENTIVHNYAQAESLCAQLIKSHPQSPVGYFYYSSVLNSMMVDYEDDFREAEFFRYAEKAMKLAHLRTTKNPLSAEDYFYYGSASAYIAFQHTHNDRYFSALGYGIKAIDAIKKAVELDSNLFDAYLALGNYEYWVSRKANVLKVLPFISDKRQEGIDKMYIAMRRGKYSAESSASALAWALIDAGRYEEVLQVISKPLAKYPTSRFFLFAQARALFELNRYSAAFDVYSKLLISYRSAPFNNHYNEIGILRKLAECAFAQGDYARAEKYIREGLRLTLNDEVKERCRRVLDKLQEMEFKVKNKKR
jgi:tetratricopeptide (TPR) repeat protein